MDEQGSLSPSPRREAMVLKGRECDSCVPLLRGASSIGLVWGNDMSRPGDRASAGGANQRTVRAWYGCRIVVLVSALVSYWIPLYDDVAEMRYAGPFLRYISRPHIDRLDASWSGQFMRLLLTATIWCLGSTLVLAIRVWLDPRPSLSRWLTGMSLVSTGMSIWVLVEIQDLLWDGARAPGVVTACAASGVAFIGTLVMEYHCAKRSPA